MRIFGIKLPARSRYIHEEECDDCDSEAYKIINPENTYSSACHLYEDKSGKQYIGFELSLQMGEDEMFILLGNKGKVHTLRM